ncbi:MAG: AarF/ABC1/UbiB kinase family protein [Anaerolineae bacterium]
MPLTPRHLNRYRQIAEVLIAHGFGAVLSQLGLPSRLNLTPRRFRHRPAGPESEKSVAEHTRLALEELGPTFVKLGQILSTRPDLMPPQFLEELSRLQDAVPPAPWEQIKEVLEGELDGPLEQFFPTFDPQPLAAASLAQVHAASLPDGSQVVVKIQRPNIEKTINLDLDILYDMARLAKGRLPVGDIDLVELAEEFALTLRGELDYRREAHNADRFRKNFTGEPDIYVPTVYWDYTTRRVLVQEQMFGIKINDIEAIDAAGHNRHQLALNSARFIVKEILEDGFFHADPHPGNIFVLPGGVIGVMDFGTMGQLDPNDRAALVRLYVTAVRLDTVSLVEQLIQVGVADINLDRPALQRDIRRLLLKYHGLPLQDVRAGDVMESLRPIIYRHRLRLPSNFWLLAKTLVMMEGVGLRLDPDFDIYAVSEPYVRRFLMRMWLPASWGPSLAHSATGWADLLNSLPRQTTRILSQVERGDLELQIGIPLADQYLNRIDRIVTRIVLTVLMAAIILALALLIPRLNLGQWPWDFITWIVVTTFAVMVFMGIWLILSILRSGGRL